MPQDNALQGLDMRAAIIWYERFAGPLLALLPQPSSNPPMYLDYEHAHRLQISTGLINGLIRLFPRNAIKRSIATTVVGQPTAWIHKDSTLKKPFFTTKPEEALSPTALAPPHLDYYTTLITTDISNAEIYLYRIPLLCSAEVIKILLCRSFVHEFAHSLDVPARWIDGYQLKLPDGQIVTGFDLLKQFTDLAEQYPSISGYASIFRNADGIFMEEPDEIATASDEELATTITAYLLGFAFCGDDQRSLNPLADRPEITIWVSDFLQAERIS